MDTNKHHNSLVLYRRRMGFSQKQVASLLGRNDSSTLSHYEHGRALPTLTAALCLEIIYLIPVAFLFPEMYQELKMRIRGQEEILAGRGQRPLF